MVDIYDTRDGAWVSTYSLPTSAGKLNVERELLVGAAAGGVIVFAGGRYRARASGLFLTY